MIRRRVRIVSECIIISPFDMPDMAFGFFSRPTRTSGVEQAWIPGKPFEEPRPLERHDTLTAKPAGKNVLPKIVRRVVMTVSFGFCGFRPHKQGSTHGLRQNDFAEVVRHRLEQPTSHKILRKPLI